MTDLGLESHVKQCFGFLESEEGYVLVESTPTCVRFESAAVTIAVVFDGNRSLELGLLIAPRGLSEPDYSIDEILRLRGVPEAEKLSLIQVRTPEVLARFVRYLAETLKKYGRDFIEGNERSFAELAAWRRRGAEQYALDRELSAARAKLEKAWHAKDYASVVKVLQPLRPSLTPTELGKLKYAEARSRG